MYGLAFYRLSHFTRCGARSRSQQLILFSLDLVNMFLRYWFWFLLAAFAVSVLTLSFVQTKLIRREGWRVFRTRSVVQLYWREISPLERFLIWTGIAAFFLTFFALAVSTLVRQI